MAEWNKNKVEPSAINNGQEFKLKDNLSIDELNAIVNNSFYASDKAKRAEELAESVVKGNGTNVTIDGKIQGEWSADFAESERQKSKNLCPVNNISAKGNKDVLFDKQLPAGTYTLSAVATSNSPDTGCLVEVYDKGVWKSVFRIIKSNERQSNTKTIEVPFDEIRFYAGSSNIWGYDFTFTDIQLEEGSVATDYHPYNGAIVHEKDIADVEHIEVIYDKDSSDKNTIGGVAYANGVGADLVSDTNLSGGTVSITSNYSFEKYNKVIAIFEAGAGNGRFEVQLHKINSNTLTGTSAGYPVNISASRMFFVYVRFNNGAISFKPRSIVNGSSEISVFNSEYFKLIKFYGVY